MIFISHRGNLRGPNPKYENSPEYVLTALNQGYEVEIDVWFINNRFMLGHDSPKYSIEESFLLKENIWCHAKNFEALIELKKLNAHYFWHESDSYTITSKNIIWAYPDSWVNEKCIRLMPELRIDLPLNWNYLGICSDYIEEYKMKFLQIF